MTWTVTFSNDTSLPDVGSVTATWSAPGESLTVSLNRFDSKADGAAAVAKCRASLAAYRSKQTKLQAIATALEAALNA